MGCYYTSSFTLDQLNAALERSKFIKTVSFVSNSSGSDGQLLTSFIGGVNTRILEDDVDDFVKNNAALFHNNETQLSFPYVIQDSVVFYSNPAVEIYHEFGSSDSSNYGNVLQYRLPEFENSPASESDWLTVAPAFHRSVFISPIPHEYIQFRIKWSRKGTAPYTPGGLFFGDGSSVIIPNSGIFFTESDVYDISNQGYNYFVWNSGVNDGSSGGGSVPLPGGVMV